LSNLYHVHFFEKFLIKSGAYVEP